MKRLLILLLAALPLKADFFAIKETIIQLPYTSASTPTRTALLKLPDDYSTSGSKVYPLLIFLHGAGESVPGSPTGSTLYDNTSAGGPAYVIEHGVWGPYTNPVDGQSYDFIVVSPFSNNGWSTSGDELENTIKYLVANYRVDVNRIYGTGLSAGGAGCLEYAAHLDAGESVVGSVRTYKFAAFVPMSEASNAIQLPWAQAIIADSVRCWGFGNFADTHGAITNDLVSYMNFVRTGYAKFSQYTQGTSTGGHCCWNFFYDPTYRESFTWKTTGGVSVTSNMNIYEWMLTNTRSNVINIGANAGSPQTITLPTNSVTLTGTGNASSGHSFVGTGFAWTKQSGPGSGTITSPTSATTTVTGLVAGTYVFLLTVSDNAPSTATSTVTIQVNSGVHQPPTVTVSPDQTIALSATSIPITSAPVANGGSIASISWTKLPFNQTPIKVGILGSSTSVGTAASDEAHSYVGLLTSYWQSLGIVSSVLNLANGGADIGSALPTGTVPMLGLSSPDPIRNVTAIIAAGGIKVVILNFPTNAYDASSVTPTVVGQEAQIIVNALAAAGIECYVTTTQTRVDFTQAVQDKLKVIRDTILNRFGSHAINFYDGLNVPGTTLQIPAYAAGDGIHFNDLGHSRLFDLVKAKNIFQNLVTKTGTIVTPTASATNITGMDTGVHKFNVGVVDADGLAANAIATVTVNPAPPSSCHGTKYVINPNSIDSSFFQDGGYNAGDTILLNDAGKAFTNVVFVDLNGTSSCPVVIMNDPALSRAVKFRGATAQLALGNCVHIRVTGSGVPGVQYGVDMDGYPGGWTAANAGGSYFGYVTSGRSSNIEWDHLYTRHGAVGFEVKQDGDCDSNYIYPNWVMDSVIIHDVKVQTPWNEGMYIGNTSPDNGATSYDPRPVDCNGTITYPRPIRVGYVHVYNAIVDSTGRGGIQLASGNGKGMEVDHCTVTHNGWSGDDAQGTGISFGTYTWPYIHDNIVRNQYTWGIACIGGGFTSHPIRIENNTVDSSGYMQYYIDPVAGTIGANTLQWPVAIEITTKPVDSLPALDSTQFYIKTNKIGRFKNIDGYFAALDDGYNRIQRTGNIICGNTALDGITPMTSVYNNNNAPAIPYSSNCFFVGNSKLGFSLKRKIVPKP